MAKVGRWRSSRMPRLPREGTWEERLAHIKATWEIHPFWKLLGIEPVGLGPGYARVRVAFDPDRHGPWPHGGLLASLVDTSCALALFAAYGPEDEDVAAHATADLNVSFLDSMEGNELFAEGRILRKARTAAFASAEVRDGHGRLIAVGRATFLMRREPSNSGP